MMSWTKVRPSQAMWICVLGVVCLVAAVSAQAQTLLDHGVTNVIPPTQLVREFLTTEEQVYSWVSIGPITGRHQVAWKWFTPSGKLWLEHGPVLIGSAGETYAFAPVAQTLEISGNGLPPGKWRVDVYLDEMHLVTDRFEIVTDTSYGDYGDAPDGAPCGYTVDPTQDPVGRFPTLFASPYVRIPGSPGAHFIGTDVALGRVALTSREADANDPEDPDGTPNLVDDDTDDGLYVELQPNGTLQFAVVVSRSPSSAARICYLNALYDVNRDGEWKESVQGEEWIAENLRLEIEPGGQKRVIVPIPLATNWMTAISQPRWLRLAVSSLPIDATLYGTVGGWDGGGGFENGEVEDYKIGAVQVADIDHAIQGVHRLAYASARSHVWAVSWQLLSAMTRAFAFDSAYDSANAFMVDIAHARDQARDYAASASRANASAVALAATAASAFVNLPCVTVRADASASAAAAARAAAAAFAWATASATATADAYAMAASWSEAFSLSWARAKATAVSFAAAAAEAYARAEALAESAAGAEAFAGARAAIVGTGFSADALALAQAWVNAFAWARARVEVETEVTVATLVATYVEAIAAAWAQATAAADAIAFARAQAFASANAAAHAVTIASAAADAIAKATASVTAAVAPGCCAPAACPQPQPCPEPEPCPKAEPCPTVPPCPTVSCPPIVCPDCPTVSCPPVACPETKCPETKCPTCPTCPEPTKCPACPTCPTCPSCSSCCPRCPTCTCPTCPACDSCCPDCPCDGSSETPGDGWTVFGGIIPGFGSEPTPGGTTPGSYNPPGIPANIINCARRLAWSTGYEHISESWDRWDVNENNPTETCLECGGARPMCVVCMDNDIQIYLRSTQTTSANKTCAQLLYNYLQRTPSMKEAIAAVYWEYYFYGRRNQNKPF